MYRLDLAQPGIFRFLVGRISAFPNIIVTNFYKQALFGRIIVDNFSIQVCFPMNRAMTKTLTHTRMIKCEDANCQKAMSLCGRISALGGDLGVREERVGDDAIGRTKRLKRL